MVLGAVEVRLMMQFRTITGRNPWKLAAPKNVNCKLQLWTTDDGGKQFKFSRPPIKLFPNGIPLFPELEISRPSMPGPEETGPMPLELKPVPL